MFVLISNEPIKVADLIKSANQLMLKGALADRNDKQVFQ